MQYRKSLTPKKKGCIVKSDTAAHTKKRESLLPKKKAHMLEINAAKREKYRKSLLPKKKAHVLAIDATEHIKHRKSLSKQIADQIKRYADTHTTAIDLDQATIEFL